MALITLFIGPFAFLPCIHSHRHLDFAWCFPVLLQSDLGATANNIRDNLPHSCMQWTISYPANSPHSNAALTQRKMLAPESLKAPQHVPKAALELACGPHSTLQYKIRLHRDHIHFCWANELLVQPLLRRARFAMDKRLPGELDKSLKQTGSGPRTMGSYTTATIPHTRNGNNRSCCNVSHGRSPDHSHQRFS